MRKLGRAARPGGSGDTNLPCRTYQYQESGRQAIRQLGINVGNVWVGGLLEPGRHEAFSRFMRGSVPVTAGLALCLPHNNPH